MAEIRPFCGVLYDTTRVAPDAVIAPPYDVINDDERNALAARDPHNAVHLILPHGDLATRYNRASSAWSAFQASGALVTQERPALYRYHQVFQHPEQPGREVTRRGFIAAVRLHRFEERVILPHERTLKGPKLDRLELMRATSAHLSPIFGLYSDPAGEGDRLFSNAEDEKPILEGRTDDGTVHRLWAVTDRELCGDVARLLGPLPLYIADGHHRYETMLAYRDELRKRHGGTLPSDSSGEFATMFLANMDDTGMIVLATHRQIHSVADFDYDDLERRLAPFFDRESVACDAEEIRSALGRLGRPGFVAAASGKREASLFTLKADAAHPAIEGPLGQLDVTALHDIVLDETLGIDKAAQEAKTNIRYLQGTEEALARLAEGQVTFILRPTTLAQVRAVSDASGYMPQKSTFFVPKLATGMVYRAVDVEQTVP